VPSFLVAQVWYEPAVMLRTPLRPETATGRLRLVVVLSPNWPLRLLPQQATVVSALTAQVWNEPVAMSVAPLIPRTVTGIHC